MMIMIISMMISDNSNGNSNDDEDKISNYYSHHVVLSTLLRSYDTLYRRHLLVIGQTKIIYYNLPDIIEKLERN